MITMKKKYGKMLAAFLALVMAAGVSPINILATVLKAQADDDTVIIGFSPLDDNIENQVVSFGAEKWELDLPSYLEATVKMQIVQPVQPVSPSGYLPVVVPGGLTGSGTAGVGSMGSATSLAASLQDIMPKAEQDDTAYDENGEEPYEPYCGYDIADCDEEPEYDEEYNGEKNYEENNEDYENGYTGQEPDEEDYDYYGEEDYYDYSEEDYDNYEEDYDSDEPILPGALGIAVLPRVVGVEWVIVDTFVPVSWEVTGVRLTNEDYGHTLRLGFDGEMAGVYTFTAMLGEEFVLYAGVSLPAITVA